MNITEKYCLKWNEFSLYICDSFKELRNDNNFCDVTLACDDGEQIKANKVVLSSCSPVLKNLLKCNPHPHPLVVMRGYTSQYLKQLIDFMYFGEVDVAQQDFDEFLRGAKDLQVKGLSEDKTYHQKPKLAKSEKTKVTNSPQHSQPVPSEVPGPASSSSHKKILEVVKTKVSINHRMIDDVPAKQVVLPPQFNVTISPLATNPEQDSKHVTVKKQEETEEEDDAPECFDVSDTEDTEMITDNTVETYQAVPHNRMVVNFRPAVETQQAVVTMPAVTMPAVDMPAVTMPAVNMPAVERPAVNRPAVTIPAANKTPSQTVTFAPVEMYTQVPHLEIYRPASSAPSSTSAPTDPLQTKTKKPVVVENIQKSREKEDDPILKMFSMRSAGGWTCTSCGQFSNQKNAMKVHIQTNHMSGFGHVCDECGKSFRTRGRLLSHIDQTHAGT